MYGIAATELAEHPLRPATRRKLVVELAPGMRLNGAGELEGVDLDLGTVISARPALDYDAAAWRSGTPNVQPAASTTRALVEYVAHPAARLYLGGRTVALQELDASPAAVAAAERPVKIRVTERGSAQPVAVRLHLHGAAGEYLPPKGYHRTVNGNWFEDNYGEFVNGYNQYAYIPGECVADLPLGDVFVEISRGYEVRPLRTRVTVTPQTDELTFELERVLHWRERGWVTADTHVHFLSPQTALLEGAAEGVNVVNLLASQWGEMFSNVADFDGATTLGARDFGGSGEFLVRVGTENRMQVLGHISLLGYAGAMIHPLCTGGPSESAIGDPQEVTMADWATRCLEQGGLVVMPHGPNPQCERAADVVLGVVDAMEMMTFNPCDAQLNPYGIADWYRYLNLGYRLPVVGGSDKMAASSQLGGVRTYTQLGEREFTYDNWMAALRAGNTFVTVGPLAGLTVEGRAPGAVVELPPGGGTVAVEWRVESVSVPITAVETDPRRRGRGRGRRRRFAERLRQRGGQGRALFLAGAAGARQLPERALARHRGPHQRGTGQGRGRAPVLGPRRGPDPRPDRRCLGLRRHHRPAPRCPPLPPAPRHPGGRLEPPAPDHAPPRRVPPPHPAARPRHPPRTLIVVPARPVGRSVAAARW